MLPATAVARVGLPAPFFIKWEDAEYGLRARAQGMATVTLPGTAVYHPAWDDKGTLNSWVAFPLHRNRLATAAAYGAGRGVIVSSLAHQVKHALRGARVTLRAWNAAAREVAAGPEWLAEDLAAFRQRAQRVVAGAQVQAGRDGAGAGKPSRRWRDLPWQLIETLAVHAALAKAWPRARAVYPGALAEARSAQVWRARWAERGDPKATPGAEASNATDTGAGAGNG
jgi:galactofuranosylgalactofuranosylrhamnosyl-N-acetylglucosaminyl-diphospho-decaprenol beta-1,5/1,6-galactofuranosyltransferase